MFTSKLRKSKAKPRARKPLKLTVESENALKRAALKGYGPSEMELIALTMIEQTLPIPRDYTAPGDPTHNPPPQ
ncbi:MAG TPA: hypothetical protein V6C81_15150 [Planktothrix sp.]|jgi:hypothetical protein